MAVVEGLGKGEAVLLVEVVLVFLVPPPIKVLHGGIGVDRSSCYWYSCLKENGFKYKRNMFDLCYKRKMIIKASVYKEDTNTRTVSNIYDYKISRHTCKTKLQTQESCLHDKKKIQYKHYNMYANRDWLFICNI